MRIAAPDTKFSRHTMHWSNFQCNNFHIAVLLAFYKCNSYSIVRMTKGEKNDTNGLKAILTLPNGFLFAEARVLTFRQNNAGLSHKVHRYAAKVVSAPNEIVLFLGPVQP